MAIKWRDVEGPLLEDRWEIDCVEITLTQNETPTPRVHRGKGYLRQDEEGVACFRLYPTKSDVLQDPFADYTPGNEGKLVPGSSYYSLTATDWYGRVWRCPRVDPDTNYTHLNAEQHRVVSGKAYELVTEDDSGFSSDAYFLKMVFRADVEIPVNTGTDIVTYVAGKEAGRSGMLNVAIFWNEQFGEFRIWTESGRLFLTCEAKHAPQPNFYIRVMEALSFVLGRRMSWSFTEEYRERKKITRLRGQERPDEKNMPEPVGRRTRDRECHTWLLFADYLRFINAQTGTAYHRERKASNGTIPWRTTWARKNRRESPLSPRWPAPRPRGAP